MFHIAKFDLDLDKGSFTAFWHWPPFSLCPPTVGLGGHGPIQPAHPHHLGDQLLYLPVALPQSQPLDVAARQHGLLGPQWQAEGGVELKVINSLLWCIFCKAKWLTHFFFILEVHFSWIQRYSLTFRPQIFFFVKPESIHKLDAVQAALSKSLKPGWNPMELCFFGLLI